MTETFQTLIADCEKELTILRKNSMRTSPQYHIIFNVQNTYQKAQQMVRDAIERVYKNRRFVTGNIMSQAKEEEAYRKGWLSCLELIKKELGL